MQQRFTPADLSGDLHSIYFESAKLLYNKNYDTLEGYSFDTQFDFNEAEFAADWEPHLISEEGKKEMKRREEIEKGRRSRQDARIYEKTNRNTEVYRETIQYQDDRIDDLLAILTKLEENTRTSSQPAYTSPYFNNSYPSSSTPKSYTQRYTGKVETDHHRMMSQVKQVAAIGRRLNK